MGKSGTTYIIYNGAGRTYSGKGGCYDLVDRLFRGDGRLGGTERSARLCRLKNQIGFQVRASGRQGAYLKVGHFKSTLRPEDLAGCKELLLLLALLLLALLLLAIILVVIIILPIRNKSDYWD